MLLNPGNWDFSDSESVVHKGGSQKEAGSPWGERWGIPVSGAADRRDTFLLPTVAPISAKAGWGLCSKAAKYASQRGGCFSATSEQG